MVIRQQPMYVKDFHPWSEDKMFHCVLPWIKMGCFLSAGENVIYKVGAPWEYSIDHISLFMNVIGIPEGPTWSKSLITWKQSISSSVTGFTCSPLLIWFDRSISTDPFNLIKILLFSQQKTSCSGTFELLTIEGYKGEARVFLKVFVNRIMFVNNFRW